MSNKSIKDIFNIQSRYLRSAHLERDFDDPSALNGYILTPQAKSNLERLMSGLQPSSSQRAWRITGDYGSGKSSFAILLAHILTKKKKSLPPELRELFDLQGLGLPAPNFFPVLITGSREPLTLSLLKALRDSILNVCGKGRTPKLLSRLQSQIEQSGTASIDDESVIEFISETNNYIISSGKAAGLLIIIDELGKSLEFAAFNPDRQDVYFLQKLAESAARSSSKPLFIVGLLHQGFNAYADSLSHSAQKEWEKVAGRFDELLFNQPLEQTAILVSDALKCRINLMPKNLIAQTRREMKSTLNIDWYGPSCSKKTLTDNATSIYPLHPTVIPPLVKVFQRFGQNERSLFSFLLSNEPFSLQDLSHQSVSVKNFYRLHNLYDYVRAAFGHRLGVQSYRSHWNLIDSIVDSFPVSNDVELKVLKTVGLLGLIDDNALLPSEELITLAVAGENSTGVDVKAAIKKLRKSGTLHYRGVAGGYCLWHYTSVNLEKTYQDAAKALGTTEKVSTLIKDYLETRPIVARRHYIMTGNLRHFRVQYLPVSDLTDAWVPDNPSSDGLILVPLCDTASEHKKALLFAEKRLLEDHDDILLAVPKPLGNLKKLVQEVQRWQWVAENTLELNNDSYAAEEVSRQITTSRNLLEKRIQSFIGLKQFTERMELKWFHNGNAVKINSGRALLGYLSDICDEAYQQAPTIRNELVNRSSISTAAAGARRRLIERIYAHASEPLLGMDSSKKPPEMSIYFSLLQTGGLHRKGTDGFSIVLPGKKTDKCNLRPSLERILDIVKENKDARVPISDIFSKLRLKPYGVRAGVLPIFLAVFAKLYEQDLAFYENGSFMRQVSGDDYQRIIKAPDTFDIQYCKVSGVRTDVFNKLVKVLGLKATGKRNTELLDVVRPLCVFVAQLSEYTHKTKKLSNKTISVRSALMKAREPSTLLFSDLPKACGLKPFYANKKTDISNSNEFVEALKSSLEELKTAYLELHERMKTVINEASGMPGSFNDVRGTLSDISEKVLIYIKEPRLKGFCMRLSDKNLPEQEWLESLGSFVCSKPPSKWIDSDEDLFEYEAKQLFSRFLRVESLAFDIENESFDGSAVRVTVTKADGTEVDHVLHVSKEEEQMVSKVETEVSNILKKSKRVGLAAVSRSIWNALKQEEELN